MIKYLFEYDEIEKIDLIDYIMGADFEDIINRNGLLELYLKGNEGE